MKQLHRRYIHLLSVTPFAILGLFIDTYLPRIFYITVACLVLVAFLSFEYCRLYHQSWREKIMSRFSYTIKEKENHALLGSIWGPIDLLILALVFSRPTVVTTLFVGSLADPIAAIIGIKYGGKKNKLGKTIAGTIAYFLTSLIFVVISLMIIQVHVSFVFILALCLLAALLEGYWPYGDDNVVAPMVFAIGMEIVLRM